MRQHNRSQWLGLAVIGNGRPARPFQGREKPTAPCGRHPLGESAANDGDTANCNQARDISRKAKSRQVLNGIMVMVPRCVVGGPCPKRYRFVATGQDPGAIFGRSITTLVGQVDTGNLGKLGRKRQRQSMSFGPHRLATRRPSNGSPTDNDNASQRPRLAITTDRESGRQFPRPVPAIGSRSREKDRDTACRTDSAKSHESPTGSLQECQTTRSHRS
ncbi:MAG: hypothetical protein CM1200mP2_33000 [Planctomycetaceae bacterium]|nr:MAG: hypothetical protein CM1200mP2_33000 [Planctomycetaceae bacterium]